MNLTSLTGSTRIRRLVAEPLWVARQLSPTGRYLDIGSGNGSPAIPWHLACGFASATLVGGPSATGDLPAPACRNARAFGDRGGAGTIRGNRAGPRPSRLGHAPGCTPGTGAIRAHTVRGPREHASCMAYAQRQGSRTAPGLPRSSPIRPPGPRFSFLVDRTCSGALRRDDSVNRSSIFGSAEEFLLEGSRNGGLAAIRLLPRAA